MMPAVIISTPHGTEPYRSPRLGDRICPLLGDVCGGEACAWWRGELYGCGLITLDQKNRGGI